MPVPMIDPQELMSRVQVAAAEGRSRRGDEDARRREEDEERAAKVFAEIPGHVRMAEEMGRKDCRVMQLALVTDTVPQTDPNDVKYADLRRAGKLVFDHCQVAGLNPYIAAGRWICIRWQ